MPDPITISDEGQNFTIQGYPGSIRELAELIKQLHPDHMITVGYLDHNTQLDQSELRTYSL